jgi:hypothetical protein
MIANAVFVATLIFLARYVILLHRIRDGYLTMVDLFRTVISAQTRRDADRSWFALQHHQLYRHQ